MEHSCQWIVSFHVEPGEDGDPIFCDKTASIKHWGYWYCAEHYDLIGRIEVYANSTLDNQMES
jgi:hypothetical protein